MSEIPDHRKMENELTELVTEHPDTPLEDILLHSDFHISVKSEVIVLFAYFKRPDISAELLKWALSPEYKDKEKYKQKARAAVLVLTMETRALQAELEESELFLGVIQKCLDSNFYSDLRIAGHFEQIFLSYVKFTAGGILQRFPQLIPKLIELVDWLAVNELLVQLLTTYKDAFEDEEFEEIVLQLAKATNNDNGYFVVCVIREVVKENKATAIEVFEADRVIRALLDSVTSGKERPYFLMFQVELYGVIDTIAKNSVVASFVVNEYQERVTFDPKNVTAGTIAALRVFKNGVAALFPRFFEDPPLTFLNQAIMDAIEALPNHAVKALIESQSLAQRVMDVWDTHLVNGHVTELALFLDSKKDMSATLQTSTWKEFMKSKVNARDSLRASQFQNDVPDRPTGLKPLGIQATVSFGGYGANGARAGIAGLIRFAEDMRERQAKIDAMSAARVAKTASDASAASTLQSSSLKGGLGVHSGPSFTIPTLYQAPAYTGPLQC